MRQVLWILVCLWVGAGHLSADTAAVLPFFNIAKSPDLDWIGESLAETTRQALLSQGLLVVDREDQRNAYRRLTIRPYTLLTRASVIKLAETLEVERVVFGRYQFSAPPAGLAKIKGSVSIVAQVLDLRSMKRSSEFSISGSLEDLARLQSHLAWQTLQYLAPNPALPEEVFLEQRPPIRVEAMESYTRGVLANSVESRINLYQQAIRLDPQFPQAYTELGRAYFEKKEYKNAVAWLAKAPSNAPAFRETQFLLGLSRYYAGDFAGAVNSFQVVAAAVPLNEVLNNLGVAQIRANVPEALDNLRRAAEGDQTDPAYQFNVGYILWKRGDFEAAAARFRTVLDRDPGDQQALVLLARALQHSGPKPAETKLANLERLKQKYEETAYWQLKTLLEPKR